MSSDTPTPLEYKCPKCGYVVAGFTLFTSSTTTVCPDCGEATFRRFTPVRPDVDHLAEAKKWLERHTVEEAIGGHSLTEAETVSVVDILNSMEARGVTFHSGRTAAYWGMVWYIGSLEKKEGKDER